MARGVNKVILVGNLGADPELRYLPDGKAVASLRLATSSSWTDKQNGQRQEQTEWHNVVLFAGRAENVARFACKGTRMYVEGRIQTRKVEDQNGTRYFTDIVAGDFQVLADGRPQQDTPPQGARQPPQQAQGHQGGHAPQYGQRNDYRNASGR